MPRNVATNVENSFIKGLVTDATGLNFPENAVVETDNCVYTEFGEVHRRLGIDYEVGSEPVSFARSGGAVIEYEWKAVAGLSTFSFFVLQMENTIYFFEADENAALTPNVKSFTIDLDTYKAVGAPLIGNEPCQFAAGSGYLFIYHPYMDPLYVSYDRATDSIAVESITLKIRDMTGTEDGLGLDERPVSLSAAHTYNLYNQGWYATGTNTSSAALNVVTIWHNGHNADYPGNTDVWWTYKNGLEQFDTDNIDKFAKTNSPAAKGHYILNAFFQDRATASGVATIPTVSSSYYRPSTGAFFSGRVFYSGVSYLDYTNKVYFSPIIEDPNQFGMCYQQNDPTSESIFDLLSSDGGVLTIPEAGTIYRLFPVQSSLLVFASNGIWAITGNQGIGFTANDFTVKFIAQLSITGPLSFVSVEGLPVWWGEGGIYAITGTDQLGNIGLTNISNNHIKNYFNAIPNSSKVYVKGAYNFQDKTVQWVFRSTAPTTLLERYEYDSVLVFNTLTQAFYPWSVDTTENIICGITTTRGLGARRTRETVTTVLGVDVIDLALADVYVDVIETTALPSTFRFTTITETDTPGTFDLSFSQERDGSYYDWSSMSDGVDYTSYFVSGYKVHGEGQKKFQTNYIQVFLTPTPGASCFMNTILDWASTTPNALHTPAQQIYPAAQANRVYQHNRLKVRGTGLAVQLKFTSEAGKPFGITGWSIMETGNSNV